MSKTLKSTENDNQQTKCDELKNEIEIIERRISNIRSEFYKLYQLRKSIGFTIKDFADKKQNMPELNLENYKYESEIYFYKQFIDVQFDENVLTVLFPGKIKYGLNLNKTEYGKWSIEKSFLPLTVDMSRFVNNLKQLELAQFEEHLNEIQRNVLAFSIREDQTNKLKDVLDSKIQFYHSLCYTDFEFTFIISNSETNMRKVVTVQLKYDVDSIYADDFILRLEEDEIDEDLKRFLQERFKIFMKCEMVAAYKKAFVESEKYLYFV